MRRRAAIIAKEGLAKLTLLGNPEKVKAAANGASLEGVEIIDPATSEKCAEYANLLYELRKAKGMTEEKAAQLVKDPMYYGVMMVKSGDADGLVSGSDPFHWRYAASGAADHQVQARHQDRVLLLPDGVPEQGIRR